MVNRALVLSVLVGGIVGLMACGGDDRPNASATVTVALSGAAREFFDLLNEGLGATYRVTYTTTTPEGTAGGTYVVYNRPLLTRIDTVPVGESGPATLLIGGGTGDRTIGCSGGPDAWECAEIDPLGDSLLQAAGPVAFLRPSDLATFDVTKAPTERSIAGQPATCYELAPNGKASGPSEYCLTAAGVVLYAATPSQTVEAREYSPEVSEQDLEPPVEPS